MAVEQTHYPNGQLRYERTHQTGNKRHGIIKGWWEDGKPAYTFYYLYGKRVNKEEFDKWVDLMYNLNPSNPP